MLRPRASESTLCCRFCALSLTGRVKFSSIRNLRVTGTELHLCLHVYLCTLIFLAQLGSLRDIGHRSRYHYSPVFIFFTLEVQWNDSRSTRPMRVEANDRWLDVLSPSQFPENPISILGPTRHSNNLICSSAC